MIRTKLYKAGRKARRAAAKATRALFSVAVIIAYAVAFAVVLTTFFAAINWIAVTLGVPAFVVCLTLWFVLWLADANYRRPAVSA